GGVDQRGQRRYQQVVILAPQETCPQLVRIHSRLRAQQAQQQRFARHFQREHPYHLVVEHRRIFRDVDRQRGLSHRRSRRDNDQFGLLQAAGLVVEFGEVGLQAGDALALLVELVDRPERLFDDLLYALEALAYALLRDLENLRLRRIDDLLGRPFLLVGFLYRAGGRVDEPAQQRLVLDDLDVLLDVLDPGQAVRQ